MRGVKAKMTISHPSATHAPHKHVGVQGRGSMPSHTPSYNEWRHDDDTHEDQYEAEILHHYKGLIHDRVGHECDPLPDVKNIRVSAPEKYSGEDVIEVFDTWLNGLLCWFQVYNITGDHKDSMRVDLCGTTPTGLAVSWCTDEVEAWNRRTRKWYF